MSRNLLKDNVTLCREDGSSVKFHIKAHIGSGASCVVYHAVCEDKTEHLLKEYYPRNLNLVRDEDGTLIVPPHLQDKFNDGIERFRSGNERQKEVRLSENLKNFTSNVQGYFYGNGTEYIDMTVFAGRIYSKVENETLHDLMIRMRTLAQVIGYYHDEGLLHLDIKPDNIFVRPENETVEDVMLFDFDSVIEKNNKMAVPALSYTKDWAAPEQLLPYKRNFICEATDLFSIGEIIFTKIFCRHSTQAERRSFAEYDIDYNADIFKNVNPKVVPLIKELFRHTLCAVPSRRYQTAGELIEQLDKIVALSDPKEPFIKKGALSLAGFFTGRDTEIESIHKKFKETDTIFLSGIGGIGKSELAKHYAKKYESEYDAIIFAPFVNDVQMMITDDNYVPIYNFSQYPEEKPNEYFARKMRKLGELCDKRTLIIVDNLDTTDDDNLDKLFTLGCKMLVTTRADFSYVYSNNQMNIDVLTDPFVIFNEHYKKPLSEDEHKCVDEIIEIVCGHTMTVELLAKQMIAGRVKPEKMLDKLKNGGVSDSGKEKVRTAKDGKHAMQSTYDHIQALFDLSKLDKDEKHILANLSLIPYTGIYTELFHDWCLLENYDCINRLVVDGWIRQNKDSDYISLHPVIRELELTRLSTPKKTWRKIMESVLSFIDGGGWSEFPYAKKQQFAETFRFMVESVYRKRCSSKLVAKFIRNVSECIDIYGHFLEFENYYKYVVDIQIEQSGEKSNNTALAFLSLSDYYMSVGRLTEAEELCKKALHIWEQVYGIESNSYVKAEVAWASIKKEQHDYLSAEKLMKQALLFYEATKGADSKKYLHCLDLLGDIYLSAANYDKALDCLHDCLNKRLEKWGEESISADSTRFSLSVCYRCIGNYPQAIYYGEMAFKNRQRRNGENHHSLAIVCSSLGYSYLLNDDLVSAKKYLWKALTLRQNMYGDMHRRTAESYLRMGMLYEKESDIAMATKFVEKSVNIRDTLLGSNHPDTIEATNMLEALRVKGD